MKNYVRPTCVGTEKTCFEVPLHFSTKMVDKNTSQLPDPRKRRRFYGFLVFLLHYSHTAKSITVASSPMIATIWVLNTF